MINNIDLGYYPLEPNYGFYIDKAPQKVLNELKQQIDDLQSNFSKGEKANNYLAGEIEHEYALSPQLQTKQYIKSLSQKFENESQYMISNYHHPLTLKFDDLWVNFQKKYEYNPVHHHKGVYSFVIWYKIPFTFKDEEKYNHKSPEQGYTHGKFAFVHQTSTPTHHLYQLLDIDKSKEGYVSIFPSSLRHTVHPFYSSDEYRITVAGNVRLK
jgi:hypothetical protein